MTDDEKEIELKKLELELTTARNRPAELAIERMAEVLEKIYERLIDAKNK